MSLCESNATYHHKHTAQMVRPCVLNLSPYSTTVTNSFIGRRTFGAPFNQSPSSAR